VIKLPTGKIATILKEVEELVILPDGVKRKLDTVFHLTRVVKCMME